MDMKIDRSLLEAYSRGEISRRDIGDRMDAEVRFGDLLAALHAREACRCRASRLIRTLRE